MSPNRSGASNPQSFDRDEPQSFPGWDANLHPGAVLNRALYLLPGFAGWRK
jgi:hypothetical protein